MRRMWIKRAVVASALIGVLGAAGSDPGRTREFVQAGAARIAVIAEGRGPVVDMLPSRGRYSEDFDDVGGGDRAAGFRVVRPHPRGIDGSAGPMQGLTLTTSRGTWRR